MGLKPAITIDKSRANNVIVSDVIVGTQTHVVTHTAHFTLCGLVGELVVNCVAVNDVKTLGLVHASTDVASVVEAIAGEKIPTLQAVIG